MKKQDLKAELEALKLPELQAKFAEVIGEESKSPNKKYLMRRIIEATEGTVAPETPTGENGPAEAEIQTDDDGEPKLSKLEVPELQAKYEEVLQRGTRSQSKSYLVWKIRQARQGKVPIRPRSRGEGVEHKVLPVRVPAAAVESLDQSWKRLGIKSRTEFFRRACHAYLESESETDTAALFA